MPLAPMPLELREDAPAKVNLFLHVVGRRLDGYHLLDSLVVFARVGDRLTAEPGGDLRLSITGPFGRALQAEADNLVVRAARRLAELAGVAPSGHITLHKNLPIASGIGGGSADAAAALRLLCRLWDTRITPDRMAVLAEGLGADVPVCLSGQAARMGGIGEHLLPAPRLPDAGIVLINPGVGVSTPAVFRERTGPFSPEAAMPDHWPDVTALAATLRATHNDLEPPARRLVPVIDDVLRALASDPPCLLARMSGSGATCFGLYPSPSLAEAAAGRLDRSGWWVWGGGLQKERASSIPG